MKTYSVTCKWCGLIITSQLLQPKMAVEDCLGKLGAHAADHKNTHGSELFKLQTELAQTLAYASLIWACTNTASGISDGVMEQLNKWVEYVVDSLGLESEDVTDGDDSDDGDDPEPPPSTTPATSRVN